VTLRWVVFDLDGTLVDSDRALVQPFIRLGVPAEEVTFGHLLHDECERLGISMEAYLQHYDSSDVRPFDGVEDVLRQLPRWAVCSNKVRLVGAAELERFGWKPAVALFAEDFGGRLKHLAPVLELIDAEASEVLFVGDTAHDRACAREAGAAFALASWNPRTVAEPDDIVLATPAALLDLGGGLLAG
jgi:HAD superfamily hydrolase (TIGR01549 family)